MSNSFRNDYLNAMGVQQWIVRDALETDGILETRDTVGSINSAGWSELEQVVSGCTLCGLQESRTQPVFGAGNRNADWLLVGEAPGVDEDRQDAPLTGPAGQLLTEMLLAIGLKRDQVYICNIIKCRTPDDRDPSAEELDHCKVYLQQQIALIKPGLILAVGGVAANSLLNMKEKVGDLRGKVHVYGASNTPLVVTYHPAYLLRAPLEKRKAWADLIFARTVCANAEGG